MQTSIGNILFLVEPYTFTKAFPQAFSLTLA